MRKVYATWSMRTFSSRIGVFGQFIQMAARSIIFPCEKETLDVSGKRVGNFSACSLGDSMTLSKCGFVMLFKGAIDLSISRGEIQWFDSPAPTGDNKE